MKNPFEKKRVKLNPKESATTNDNVNSDVNNSIGREGVEKSSNRFLDKLKRTKRAAKNTPIDASLDTPRRPTEPSLQSHGFIYEDDGIDNNIDNDLNSENMSTLTNEAAPMPLSKPKNNNLIKILVLIGVLLLVAALLVAYLLPDLLGLGNNDATAEVATETTVPDTEVVSEAGTQDAAVTEGEDGVNIDGSNSGVVLNENPEDDPEVQAAIQAALSNNGAIDNGTVETGTDQAQPMIPNDAPMTSQPSAELSYQDFLEASEAPILIDDAPSATESTNPNTPAPNTMPKEMPPVQAE